MRTLRLTREAYWVTEPQSWPRSAVTEFDKLFGRGKPGHEVVLHESGDCAIENSRARTQVVVSAKDGRRAVREGMARLCRRCGSLR